jgi:hypothetical protein
MRSGVFGATLIGVSALILAVGCGGSDEPAGSADTGGEARPTTPSTKPGAPKSGLTPGESRWVAESQIVVVLGRMQQDIRAFTRTGAPRGGLVYSTREGPEYGCERTLGRGGRPPTARLFRIRRLAREACDHLQRALEESVVFRATSPSGATSPGQANRAAVEREAREAKAPATRAQTLLDEARTG